MSFRIMKCSILLAISLALILLEAESRPAKQVKHCENDTDCAPGFICMQGTGGRTFRQPVCARTKTKSRSSRKGFRSLSIPPAIDLANSYDDDDYTNSNDYAEGEQDGAEGDVNSDGTGEIGPGTNAGETENEPNDDFGNEGIGESSNIAADDDSNGDATAGESEDGTGGAGESTALGTGTVLGTGDAGIEGSGDAVSVAPGETGDLTSSTGSGGIFGDNVDEPNVATAIYVVTEETALGINGESGDGTGETDGTDTGSGNDDGDGDDNIDEIGVSDDTDDVIADSDDNYNGIGNADDNDNGIGYTDDNDNGVGDSDDSDAGIGDGGNIDDETGDNYGNDQIGTSEIGDGTDTSEAPDSGTGETGNITDSDNGAGVDDISNPEMGETGDGAGTDNIPEAGTGEPGEGSGGGDITAETGSGTETQTGVTAAPDTDNAAGVTTAPPDENSNQIPVISPQPNPNDPGHGGHACDAKLHKMLQLVKSEIARRSEVNNIALEFLQTMLNEANTGVY